MSSPSNSSAAQPELAWPSVRLFGACSYALLSGTSLGANCLLAAVLFRGRVQFAKSAFFTLVLQLLCTDLAAQLVQLVGAVPTTFAGRKIFPDCLAWDVFMQLDSVAFHGTLYFSALMTANRLTVFFSPALNSAIFNAPGIQIAVSAVWLFVLAFVALYALSGCRKTFSAIGFYMYNQCAVPATQLNSFLRGWAYYASTFLPGAMLVAYLAMFVHVRCFSSELVDKLSAEEKRRKRRERRFLLQAGGLPKSEAMSLQAFLICGFLELQDLAFIFVPKLPVTGQWNFVLTFLVNWSGILLNSLSPLILFSFNSEVRAELCKLLCAVGLGKTSVSTIKVTTTAAPIRTLNTSTGVSRR